MSTRTSQMKRFCFEMVNAACCLPTTQAQIKRSEAEKSDLYCRLLSVEVMFASCVRDLAVIRTVSCGWRSLIGNKMFTESECEGQLPSSSRSEIRTVFGVVQQSFIPEINEIWRLIIAMEEKAICQRMIGSVVGHQQATVEFIV